MPDLDVRIDFGDEWANISVDLNKPGEPWVRHRLSQGSKEIIAVELLSLITEWLNDDTASRNIKREICSRGY